MQLHNPKPGKSQCPLRLLQHFALLVALCILYRLLLPLDLLDFVKLLILLKLPTFILILKIIRKLRFIHSHILSFICSYFHWPSVGRSNQSLSRKLSSKSFPAQAARIRIDSMVHIWKFLPKFYQKPKPSRSPPKTLPKSSPNHCKSLPKHSQKPSFKKKARPKRTPKSPIGAFALMICQLWEIGMGPGSLCRSK